MTNKDKWFRKLFLNKKMWIGNRTSDERELIFDALYALDIKWINKLPRNLNTDHILSLGLIIDKDGEFYRMEDGSEAEFDLRFDEYEKISEHQIILLINHGHYLANDLPTPKKKIDLTGFNQFIKNIKRSST